MIRRVIRAGIVLVYGFRGLDVFDFHLCASSLISVSLVDVVIKNSPRRDRDREEGQRHCPHRLGAHFMDVQ